MVCDVKCNLRHARYGLEAFIFFGWFCMHSTNVSLTNALMVMATQRSNVSILTNDSKVTHGEFNWTETGQSHLLSSYYIGQCFFLIPSGHVVEMIGAHRVVLFAGSVNVLLLYLTPVGARLSYYVLYLIRMGLGATAAAILPAFIAIISHTVPDNEKSFSMAILHVGGEVGQITTTLVSGYLCQYIGWPSVFYFTGTMSLIWLLFWLCFFPLVTARVTMLSGWPEEVGQAKEARPSLLTIFVNGVVVNIIFVKLCHMWFVSLFLLKFNAFTNELLGLDLNQISIIQSILQVVSLFSCLMMGALADYSITKEFGSRTNIRKCFEAIASFGTGALVFLLTVVCCSKASFYTVNIGMMITHASTTGSIGPIVMDLSPNHAPLITAVCQTMVTLVGWATSPTISWMSNLGKGDLKNRWIPVFYFTVGVLASAGVLFTLFGSAKQIDFGSKTTQDDQRSRHIKRVPSTYTWSQTTVTSTTTVDDITLNNDTENNNHQKMKPMMRQQHNKDIE